MTDTLMVSVSGVRGIVGKDLTDDVVGRWAQAFGAWIVAAGNGERRGSGATVVVGRDARTSGPAFARAAMAGLAAAGCDVIDVGLVPTPTVQLAVEHHQAGGGIVITASHNPIGVFGQIPQWTEEPRSVPHPHLTPRQAQVLGLLEHGRSTAQIARELHLSQETVRNHVRHLLRALGVNSRLEAVAAARRHHLLQEAVSASN